TAGDGGIVTFSQGATLFTEGVQSITATDTASGSLTGTATVAVSSGGGGAPLPRTSKVLSRQELTGRGVAWAGVVNAWGAQTRYLRYGDCGEELEGGGETAG